MRRDYDIVLFGATGFTGGKTAEYLARNRRPGLRWAIAGRSRDKLESLKARLCALDAGCADVGVIEAAVDDDASLARMAARAQVVLSTVGPFIDYGEPVVRACVDQATDYLDSTGEPHFWHLVHARFGREAAERGVRIVPSCGFDSIPADLGALFTVCQLPEDKPIHLCGYVRVDAEFSGGTERSAIKALAPPPPGSAPVALPSKAGRSVQPARTGVHRRPELPGWMAPMPTLDPTVVLHSAATLDRYGPDFRYAHHAVHPSLASLLAAGIVFGGLALMVRLPPLRRLFLGVVKQSGVGPSDERIARSWFRLRLIAECDGRTLQTEVSGGDPGYGETSKMLAESAMCLALDRDALPARAGVLTPAAAMGETLIAHLVAAGIRFEVLDA